LPHQRPTHSSRCGLPSGAPPALEHGSSSPVAPLVGRSARPSRSAGCQPAVVMNSSRPGRSGYVTGQRPVLLATLSP
jgi:hypothetical protein